MENRNQPEPGLGDELRRLGSQLKAILEAAWESDERQRAQSEIASALTEVAATLNSAAKDMLESPAGQKLRADVEAWGEKLRQSGLRERAHAELVDALRRVNAELAGLAARWHASPDEAEQPDSPRGEA